MHRGATYPAILLLGLLGPPVGPPPAPAADPGLEDFLGPSGGKTAESVSLPDGARVLWAPKARVWNPVWLPDGRRIACLSDEGDGAVWIVSVADGRATRVNTPAGPRTSLCRFPDGRLAYVFGKGPERRVRLFNPATGRDAAIAAGWNPDPDPGGREIVLDTARGPMLVPLGEDQTPPTRIPLPAVKAIEDAFPRFASDSKVAYVQQGNVYLWDRRAGKLDRIAQQNIQDLTYYAAAVPGPDGRHAALFSTNASALSKPASIWVLGLASGERTPRELGPGSLCQWVGSDSLLALRSGSLCLLDIRKSGAGEVLAEHTGGGTVSPDGSQLVFLYVVQDTNADGRINWRDAWSLLVKPLRPQSKE